MNEPVDPNETAELPSAPVDSLDAGLAAGFGRPAESLDWLRADLTLRIKQLTTGKPADRSEALATVKHWQQDGDLFSIRDEVALAKLPPEESEAFTQLWADVAKLLK